MAFNTLTMSTPTTTDGTSRQSMATTPQQPPRPQPATMATTTPEYCYIIIIPSKAFTSEQHTGQHLGTAQYCR